MKTKKLCKRIFALIMSLMLIAGAVPFTASAIEDKDKYEVEFTGKTTAALVKYTGSLTVLEIPEMWGFVENDHTITEIRSLAFAGTGVTEVIIPKTVTKISDTAFRDAQYIEKITVAPDNPNYTSVDGVLFNKSKTKLIYYPRVKAGASYTVPGSVTAFGEDAFYTLNFLENLTISAKVKTIPVNSLDTHNLKNINVASGNANFTSVDGVMFNKSKTTIVAYPGGNARIKYNIPNTVTKIGEMAFCASKYLQEVVIPNSVKTIDKSAFGGASIKKVNIPSSVTSIGSGAFSASNLETITIPSSITRIESYTFSGCSKLKSVKIPNSVTYIGPGVFRLCYELKDVTLSNKITSIEKDTFQFCMSMNSISIPASVKTIKNSAFSFCDGLKEVYYGGTNAMWKQITISRDNEKLTNATLHCNNKYVAPTAGDVKPTNPASSAIPSTVVTDANTAANSVTGEITEYVSSMLGETLTVNNAQSGIVNISPQDSAKQSSTVIIIIAGIAVIAAVACGIVVYNKRKK